ncbi:nitrilase-related carbon-nitrogen hydrolase [Sutcliffiella sp. NC1]|uniref:nitrilase-related carbon-nitrogen hydrolase n=1 Tax=Sutcliffiella sp. NC1 TaxID=3004096 RepID=UPI0022DDA131|nr:nitrilase-related carbon-nitrogen hydrolase [Sutcliffiella sp. NC1]WBL15069.1 carbon-nitrogen hydrolase [Sutcliffiella sp. NC1]
MPRKVNIGIIQMESKLGDVEANLRKAEEYIKEAASKHSDIVCLPELFSTGYNLRYLGEKTNELGLKYFHQSVDFLSQVAAKYKLYIIAPIAEKRELEGVLYNSALMFDREGQLMGSYAKSHLWALERFYFKEGSHYPVFETDFGKVGIGICYDAGFPEVARSLTLQGADILFFPSAWRIEDEDMWNLNLPQRALENLLFTVGVNAVGSSHDLHLFGKSKICNPRGTILTECEIDEEIVQVTTIDLDDIAKFRTEISYLRDRKPSIYQKLTEI